jgi:hypothetical protein
MSRRGFLYAILVCVLFVAAGHASAAIFISEILADPPAEIQGDANGDGIASTGDDEFVELVNTGDSAVSLAGWRIADAVRVRHVFSSESVLLPYHYFVVFGGGAPDATDFGWQTASTGTLSLNNAGDTVSLYDNAGVLVDRIQYSSGIADQSLVRVEYSSDNTTVVGHTTSVPGVLYSAGTGPDVSPVSASVPEVGSFVQMIMGLVAYGCGMKLLNHGGAV